MSTEAARQMEKTLYKIGKFVKSKKPFLFVSMAEAEGGEPKLEIVTNIEMAERVMMLAELTHSMLRKETGITP